LHILSENNRSEFLATPQLIRLDYANGQRGKEPTLLIKASTVLLKYIVLGAKMQIVFVRVDKHLLYGLHVYDDPDYPALLWSICERSEEIAAISGLLRGEACQFFLFNELAVNAAWRASALDVPVAKVQSLIADVDLGPVDYSEISRRASEIFRAIHKGDSLKKGVTLDAKNSTDWTPSRTTYITNQAQASTLELFDKDEGGHQEKIGLWLTDSLHPDGAHQSLQIPSGKAGGKQRRELTDITLSYEGGSIFIESKAISIFSRAELPNREKLKHDVTGHINKAVSQLRGGIRKVKAGVPIMDKNGNPVEIERTHPVHAIVLIPEFDLVEDREVYNLKFVAEFVQATGGYLHLVDISELLRIVQAAEMISARSNSVTPMMAFDYYLIERAKKCRAAGTLCFGMLLRFAEE